MSRNTVIKAECEASEGIEPTERQRAPGGGDIKSEDKQAGLLEALDELVHPETRCNPMSYLRWTSKSTGNLATKLVRQDFKDHRRHRRADPAIHSRTARKYDVRPCSENESLHPI